MSPRRPPRLRGFSYRGPYRYFLTICTERRRPAFVDHDVARLIVTQFLTTARTLSFAVPAYCLMPDHLHALVEGLVDDADFRGFVHRFKVTSGYTWRRHAQHSLWQEGYYDHVLRSDEATDAVIRYIVSNPIRAGLVDAIEDYRWSGSTVGSVRALADVCADWHPPGR